MNPDRVKPILDKLNIKPTDSWQTIHMYKPNKQDVCYYYSFKSKGLTYCVSGDSYSFCLSNGTKPLIYMGYDGKALEKIIKKIIGGTEQNERK